MEAGDEGVKRLREMLSESLDTLRAEQSARRDLVDHVVRSIGVAIDRVPLDQLDDLWLRSPRIARDLDDRESSSRREGRREARENLAPVHPVQAVARGRQAVWRPQRGRLGEAEDPVDAIGVRRR